VSDDIQTGLGAGLTLRPRDFAHAGELHRSMQASAADNLLPGLLPVSYTIRSTGETFHAMTEALNQRASFGSVGAPICRPG
jgi:hypothetical protein